MSEVNGTEDPVEYRKISGFSAYRVGNDGSVWSRWKRGCRRRLGHASQEGFNVNDPEIARKLREITASNQAKGGKKRIGNKHAAGWPAKYAARVRNQP